MKKSVFSVFGSVFALGAMFVGAGMFSGAGIAEAAFPGADAVGVVSQQPLGDGTTQATIAWTSYNQGPQWLDLSATDAGFAPGTFMTTGPIASGQNTFVWNELQPGAIYFARVDTQTPYGWVSSAPVGFTTQAVAPVYFPGYYAPAPELFPPASAVPEIVQPYPYFQPAAPAIVVAPPQGSYEPNITGSYTAPGVSFPLHHGFHHKRR